MKQEDRILFIEEKMDAFFSYLENSMMLNALMGYTLIIALILIVFPNEAGQSFAVRLANGMMPFTFLALGAVFMDVIRGLGGRILPIIFSPKDHKSNQKEAETC